MTIQEFKKVARILKESYKEIEAEALSNGIDIFSDEYKQLIDIAREKILTKLGYTLKEYREIKEQFEISRKSEVNKKIDEVSQKIKDIPPPIIPPTKEEITEIAHEVAEEVAKKYTKEPIITTQIVKETTHEVRIEQPKIIETTRVTRETYNDKHLKKEIDNLYQKINDIKLPEELDKEKIKKDLFNSLQLDLKKDIELLGMPDFRKLAMGLQQQISDLQNNTGTGDMVKATYDPANGARQVAFSDELTDKLGDSFETVSKNLKAYPATFAYTGDVLNTITYDLGSSLSIVKTLNYTGELLTTIVLSGDTPTGISLTKTLTYSGTTLTDITYS